MIDWARIRETHAPTVWRIVARILKHQEDALDCCQDVFAEAIERGRRGPVDDWAAFLSWLATRRAIDCLRRRNRRAAEDQIDQVPDAGQSAEQRASFDELVERVRGELAHLPERQAEAFWLVCVEDRSYREVARQMGMDSNAVGVLVHRARQHMRSRLRSLKPAPTK